jgi:hypothetical protein
LVVRSLSRRGRRAVASRSIVGAALSKRYRESPLGYRSASLAVHAAVALGWWTAVRSAASARGGGHVEALADGARLAGAAAGPFVCVCLLCLSGSARLV